MNYKKNRGFTLIEIMLVVIIIGILTAMFAPKIAGRGKMARIAAVRADIEANISTALDMYELDNGRYPTTEQGLAALIKKPTVPPEPRNWTTSYLKKKRIPSDPWGQDYMYMSPGEHNKEDYDLFSYGPDGIESDDDITNWEEESSLEE